MTKIEIVDRRLKIEILGADKVWSLKSRLDIPLEHVGEVRLGDDQKWFDQSSRAPGTFLWGVIKAGTYYYYKLGKRAFWDVHDLKKAIVIDLQNESYARLVIEVEDPQATIQLINQAMESSPTPSPAPCHG